MSRLRRARALALDPTPIVESVPYRALWIGQVVSLTGAQMRIVAVAVQVFRLTGSTAAVGLIGVVELVPLILFSIIGGVLADAVDRRRMIAFTTVGLIATSALLAFVSFGSDPSLVWIYVLTGASSALSAAERPARAAMLPSIVGLERLPAAMALRQVAFQVTQIAGPGLGGLMIAAVDVEWVYVIDAATFSAALLSLIWVPGNRPAPTESTRLESVRQGLSYSFRTPIILAIFLIDIVAMVFGMPRAVFPAMAERVFEGGPATVGLLYSAPAIGALVAALTTGWVGRVRRQGLAVIAAVGVWGGAIVLAGLSAFALPLTLLWLAVAGGADVISAIFRGTMIQQVTPDPLRGRVNAANLMVVTGGPRLGDIEAGLVAQWIGVVPSVVAGGLACLAGTAVIAMRLPILRLYRRNDRETDQDGDSPG